MVELFISIGMLRRGQGQKNTIFETIQKFVQNETA